MTHANSRELRDESLKLLADKNRWKAGSGGRLSVGRDSIARMPHSRQIILTNLLQ